MCGMCVCLRLYCGHQIEETDIQWTHRMKQKLSNHLACRGLGGVSWRTYYDWAMSALAVAIEKRTIDFCSEVFTTLFNSHWKPSEFESEVAIDIFLMKRSAFFIQDQYHHRYKNRPLVVWLYTIIWKYSNSRYFWMSRWIYSRLNEHWTEKIWL